MVERTPASTLIYFHFEYLKPMEDYVTCATYQVRFINSWDIIIIKFVSRYGNSVFDIAARCLRLHSPQRPKNTPDGFASGFMQVVVMDFITLLQIQIQIHL